MDSDGVRVLKNDRFNLNVYAAPRAVHMARKKVGEVQRVFFTFVDREGGQHVYHGSVKEAMNGMEGYGAVKGVINLSTWMGRVLRRKQKSPASRASPLQQAKRHIKKAMSVVEGNLLTQATHHKSSVTAHLQAACDEAQGLAAFVDIKKEDL